MIENEEFDNKDDSKDVVAERYKRYLSLFFLGGEGDVFVN
jgi:hypothetical protein